jgi:hypothetical protein
MNIRLVLTLSLLGLVVAIGSLVGLIPYGWEKGAWAALVLVFAGVLANRAPGRFFLHGLVTGFIAGVLSPLCQALFIHQYMEHNAKAADAFKALPPSIPPAVFVVMAAPIFAVVIGGVTGLVTWIWARFARPMPAAA